MRVEILKRLWLRLSRLVDSSELLKAMDRKTLQKKWKDTLVQNVKLPSHGPALLASGRDRGFAGRYRKVLSAT